MDEKDKDKDVVDTATMSEKADTATMENKGIEREKSDSVKGSVERARVPLWKRFGKKAPAAGGGGGVAQKKKGPPGPKPVKFRALFRFATPLERALMFIGLALAAAAGATTPLMTLMFGNMANALIQFSLARKAISAASGAEEMATLAAAKSHLIKAAGNQALYLMGIGLGMFVCTYGYMLIWTYTSEMQSRRVRERYLQAVLRQEVSHSASRLTPGRVL
jgi:ATP-binding cassette subfamily B (MDR/TAP) protein 1